MCPELQYTKDRNKNINQVKTQLATMNQNVPWTPIYKGQQWKYQSGKNTASYYEPKCVLNSNIHKSKNENINQVKTQLATMNQPLSWIKDV